MINKSPLHYFNSENTKGSFSVERLKSRSKLDKRKYRIINSLKNIDIIKQNDFNTINSNFLKKIKRLNNKTNSNNNLNYISKDKMPFIPESERKKPEKNFINLVNALINSKKHNNNIIHKNLFLKNQKVIPYKPIGYNYFEYARMHPLIINEDDNNLYLKIIDDLHKNSEADNNNLNKNTPINLQNSIKNEIELKEKNFKKIKLNPILTQSQKELNILDINNKILNYDSKNDTNNLAKNNKIINSKTIENNSISYIRKKNIFPIINNIKQINNYNDKMNNINNNQIIKQKNYKKSDIFYLVNDDLSKEKSSEKYLFKKNYSPQKIENNKKTNLIEVGWSPKSRNNKSRIGISSVAFNILNPELKSFSPMKKEIDLLNNNNFEKAPIMSEYIDTIHSGDLNLRKEYLDRLNEDTNVFHKKNYCAAYSDLYHEYKDIVNDMF